MKDGKREIIRGEKRQTEKSTTPQTNGLKKITSYRGREAPARERLKSEETVDGPSCSKNVIQLISHNEVIITNGSSNLSKQTTSSNEADADAESPSVVAQSPVKLSETALPWLGADVLLFSGHWRHGAEALMTNNGVTALMTFVHRIRHPSLSGGPLDSKFIFEQMHFHWSTDDLCGSEHSINGTKYAAEAHLVHYNCKYNSFDEAVSQPDGLAVVGFLLNACDKPNRGFQAISDAVAAVSTPNSQTRIPSKNCLPWMLDIELNECYYTYRGSLTTTPFHESVRWIVYENPISISKKQMEPFRGMHIFDGDRPTTCNARAIQPTPPGLKIHHIPSQNRSNVNGSRPNP